MNNNHLSEFINRHDGESAIIFCSGESINKFKFNSEFRDCLKIGVNYVPFHSLFTTTRVGIDDSRRLDYHISVDPHGALLSYKWHPEVYDNLKVKYNIFRGFDLNRPWFKQWDGGMRDRKWQNCIMEHIIPYIFYSSPHIKFKNGLNTHTITGEDIKMLKDNSFSGDISKEFIYGNMSVIFPTLQILLSMGIKRIYLVGCDIEGGYWFKLDEEYEKFTDDKWSSYNLAERWLYFKEWIEGSEKYNDVEVISVNPVGLKGMFEDKYL